MIKIKFVIKSYRLFIKSREKTPRMVIHVYINGNVALNSILAFLVKNILKPLTALSLLPFFSSFYGYGYVALKG